MNIVMREMDNVKKKKEQNGIYRNKNKLSKVNILLDRISSILDLH